MTRANGDVNTGMAHHILNLTHATPELNILMISIVYKALHKSTAFTVFFSILILFAVKLVPETVLKFLLALYILSLMVKEWHTF